MVNSLGASLSFRTVQERASQIDSHIRVADLESLQAAIQQKRDWLAKQRVAVAEQVKEQAAKLMQQSLRESMAVEHDQPERLAAAKAQAVLAVDQAADLRGRKAGFVMKVFNYIRAFMRSRGGKRGVQAVEAATRALVQSAAMHREMAVKLQADPLMEADRRLKSHTDSICKLEALLESPEARGSAGELAVAAELQGLSDDFWVFHDVRLLANTFLRFDEKPVQSAQVDHLVVGPTGVFLIETKSWSRSTASGKQYFDPYEQVGRAGLLCHCLLKDSGLPNRVRTIIASHQWIAESRLRGYTERMPPDRLAGYLQTRQAALSSADVARVVAFVKEHLSVG